MRIVRFVVPAFALLALLPVSAQAADLRQGPDVTIGAGQTVTDDVYATGSTIDVAGTIDGNLIVAGGTVTVSGTVTRDLMIAGGTVSVPGRVGGSVRTAGGTVTITGPVAEDVVMAGGTLEVGPNATVGRDVLAGGGTATLAGGIVRRVLASADTLVLRGPVGGDVRANVNTLRLESGARIGGDLIYTSANRAIVSSGATVAGQTQQRQPSGAAQRSPAERFLEGLIGWLRTLIGLFLLGLVLVLLFPRLSRKTSEAVQNSPLASLGLGVALLVGVPLLSVIAFVIGLLVGGWWLAVIAVGLYAVALAVGYVETGLFLGRRGLELAGRPGIHPLLALLAGLVVLTLVGLVPFVGPLISLAAVVFGLGALTVALWRGRPTLTA